MTHLNRTGLSRCLTGIVLLLVCGCVFLPGNPELSKELHFPGTRVSFPRPGVFEISNSRDTLRFTSGSGTLLWNGIKVSMASAVSFDEEAERFSLDAGTAAAAVAPLAAADRISVPPPKVIMIDPGHGGSDQGAVRRLLPEKELNLRVAMLLCRELTRRGFKVIMTRRNDRRISLDQRLEAAEKTVPDIFVSIHHNAAVNTSAHGYEIYAPPAGRKNSSVSLQLAAAIQRRMITGLPVNDRGVKTANFKVLRTTVPAVLVEAGFLSNPDEENAINTPSRQLAAAGAVAAGIADFAARCTGKRSVSGGRR